MEIEGSHSTERRQHKMYVTRNTEYHFRGQVCVAVRDRNSGRWLESHLAVNRRLCGGVSFLGKGRIAAACRPPEIGEALYFGDGRGRELVTSQLCSVTRPEKSALAQYVASETG